MSMPLYRLWIALSCCVTASAQGPAAKPVSGTIAGIVVDRNTNAPIRRAVVTLSTTDTPPQDAVAWSDANGRFAFGYLPAGRYELRVNKYGFETAAYGADSPRRPPATIQLAAGEIRTDFVFRMQQVTSISGVVVDEQGDPIRSVIVSAMRQGWQRGKRQLLPGPGASSDSNGHYRISGIAPGRYVIVATNGNRAGARIHPEAAAGQAEPPYFWGTQYYPGTDRAESATILSVEAGGEYSNIDFHLNARPNPTVRGKIIPPPGVTKLEQPMVMAGRGDLGNRTNMGAGVSQPDWAFRFDQLQPGSYTLVAQASAEGKRYRGVQSLELGSADVSDVSITLQPSTDVSGTVSVEGPDAAKHPASFVSLVSGDGIPWNGPQLRAEVAPDGTFKIHDVPPGVWDINAGPVPPGGYIKSMHLGDQDVLTEEMVIQPSTEALLKIVLGTRAAAVQGNVSVNGQPARAFVLLAPEARYRHVFSFYRQAVADANGHFEIKNAAPGKYQLFAFDEFDPQSIQDPEFLKPFETLGIPVTLREGANPPETLSLVSLSNSQVRPASGDAQ